MMLKTVNVLSYSVLEVFLRSMMQLMKLELRIPDYTTFLMLCWYSKRPYSSKGLHGPILLVVDSTMVAHRAARFCGRTQERCALKRLGGRRKKT